MKAYALIAWSLAALLIAACAAGAPAAAPTSTPTPFHLVDTVPPPPTASFTPPPPSATPSATATATATVTPTPSVTLQPSETPTATTPVDPCLSLPAAQIGPSVQLTVVNESGQEVTLNLEDCSGSGTLIFATIPAGSGAEPVTKRYNLPSGSYRITSNTCGSRQPLLSGLALTGSLELTFDACPTATPAP